MPAFADRQLKERDHRESECFEVGSRRRRHGLFELQHSRGARARQCIYLCQWNGGTYLSDKQARSHYGVNVENDEKENQKGEKRWNDLEKPAAHDHSAMARLVERGQQCIRKEEIASSFDLCKNPQYRKCPTNTNRVWHRMQTKGRVRVQVHYKSLQKQKGCKDIKSVRAQVQTEQA